MTPLPLADLPHSVRLAAPARLPDVAHPGKVVDRLGGTSKLALMRYFDAIAPRLLAELRGRPVALLRAPTGVGGIQFFHRHRATHRMPHVRELAAELWPGHRPLLQIDNHDALLAAAEANVVEFHTWNAPSHALGRPDRLVFDLDPGDGMRWDRFKQAAELLRDLLGGLGLPSRLKTSGGRGLHLVVAVRPEHPAAVLQGLARAIADHAADNWPDRFSARGKPALRSGLVFVALRNAFDATTVAAYSPRARPGLGVSMPLPWEALAELRRSDEWTVRNALEQLALGPHDGWWCADDAGADIEPALEHFGQGCSPAVSQPARPAGGNGSCQAGGTGRLHRPELRVFGHFEERT